jgi:F-type H+-transporting ATPase subunit delta
MSAGQVAYRYAKAWLSAANDQKAMEQASADCNALMAMVKASSDFAHFIQSPLLSKQVQAGAVAKIAKDAKFHSTTASMLSVLSDNRRLMSLVAVLDAAKTMIEAASGTARAQVTSAVVLEEGKISDIRAQLKQKLGHDVSIETRVDPAIIGGLVVRVGSTMIDDSIKTKLDRMARALTGKTAA